MKIFFGKIGKWCKAHLWQSILIGVAFLGVVTTAIVVPVVLSNKDETGEQGEEHHEEEHHEEEHHHVFAGAYAKDGVNHWQRCECGEFGPKEAHNYVNGVCSVCGHTQIIPVKDYTVTAQEWEDATHTEKPFYFADNYKLELNSTLSGEVPQTRSITFEVDGSKVKSTSNMEATQYFSYESSKYYVYSYQDAAWKKDQYQGTNPILAYYSLLEPFGDSTQFTLDDSIQGYKASSLMDGFIFNATIFFKNKAITKFEFDSYVDSSRSMGTTHNVINITYNGQSVTLPELPPELTSFEISAEKSEFLIGETITLTATPTQPSGAVFGDTVTWIIDAGDQYISCSSTTGTTIQVTGEYEGEVEIKAICGFLTSNSLTLNITEC